MVLSDTYPIRFAPSLTLSSLEKHCYSNIRYYSLPFPVAVFTKNHVAHSGMVDRTLRHHFAQDAAHHGLSQFPVSLLLPHSPRCSASKLFSAGMLVFWSRFVDGAVSRLAVPSCSRTLGGQD